MDSATKPSVLFVYYTYTQQTVKVLEAMGEVGSPGRSITAHAMCHPPARCLSPGGSRPRAAA